MVSEISSTSIGKLHKLEIINSQTKCKCHDVSVLIGVIYAKY